MFSGFLPQIQTCMWGKSESLNCHLLCPGCHSACTMTDGRMNGWTVSVIPILSSENNFILKEPKSLVMINKVNTLL